MTIDHTHLSTTREEMIIYYINEKINTFLFYEYFMY